MRKVTVLTACGILAAALCGDAVAQRMPLMGWSSWNTYGLDINE